MRGLEKGDYVSVRIQSDTGVVGPSAFHFSSDDLFKYKGQYVVGKIYNTDRGATYSIGGWIYYMIDARESIGMEISAHENTVKRITQEEYFKCLLAGPKQDSKEEKL